MKKSKKALLAALSCLCIGSAAFGVAACNDGKKVTITKLAPETTYYVGDSVYVFDLFEYQDGVEYTFTVTDAEGKTKTVEGTFHYFNEAGIYTVTCTGKSGKKKATDSVTVEILEETSFMMLTSMSAQVDLNATLSERRVIALGTPIVLTNVYSEEYVESVIIYDSADGSGRTVEIREGVATGDGFWDGSKFKFIYECDYTFNIVSETAGGKVSAELKITAKENFDGIEMLTDTISYDSGTRTVSWSEIDGAESYRVKIDRKSATVQKNSSGEYSLCINDYLDPLKEFQYFDLRVLPSNAQGEVMGQLIVKDVVTAPAGSEGVVLGSGASVDATTKTATLLGRASYTATAGDIAKMDNSHIAFAGGHDVGTYVDFEFTGNNLPNVMFFAEEINGDMTMSGGDGYILMNGLYSSNRGTTVSSTNVVGENRFVCFGPELIESGKKTSDGRNHALHNYISASEQTREYLVAENSMFTQKYLREDSSARTYRYTVGSFDKGGKLAFECKLYDAKTDELLELAVFVTPTDVEDVKEGHIIAYASVKGSGDNTVFTYSLPYEGTPEDRSRYWQSATPNADGSVTLAGMLQPGAGYTSNLSKNSGVASYVDASYVGISGEYGIGTYIDIEFKGNNLPNVMFFADKINGDMTSYGGKGVLVAGGIKCSIPLYRGESRLAVYGPNRIPAAYDPNGGLDKDTYGYYSTTYGYVYNDNDSYMTVGTSLKYADYPLLTAKGLTEDVSDRTYRYTVGAYLNAGGYIAIDIRLYDATTNENIYDTQIVTKLTESDVTAGNIVIYGAVKGTSEATTFKYGAPYTGTVDPIKAASLGATRNADGSVTLAGKSYGTAGYTSALSNQTAANGGSDSNNSYVGISGEYGIGTYIDIEFTGNNLPSVMFFADKINGDMTSYGGKGVLVAGGIKFGTWERGYSNLYIYGPNRIPAAYDANKGLVGYDHGTYGYVYADGATIWLAKLSNEDHPLLTQTGLNADTSGDTYKYTVGTSLNGEGKIVVDIRLYNETTKAELYSVQTPTTLTESDVTAGNIVVYGVVKGSDTPTTFKYSEPYTDQA